MKAEQAPSASVSHIPVSSVVSSICTYSCLLDSRTKLPIASFRYNGRLYDKSGREIPRDLLRRDYLPLFALEDSCKQIRSDGAYDYVKLSGDSVRRYSGNTSQVVESGVLYPPDSWTQDGYYQPYAYSMTLATAFNSQIQTTPYEWIQRSIVGQVYKPEPSSRWEITGGIIPDALAEKIEVPLDLNDYLSSSNKVGHLVWAFGRPSDIGLQQFHDGTFSGPILETIAGLQDSTNLCLLSTMWLYPEAKLHSYQGYMQNEINVAQGIRIDFRSRKSESLHSKRGPQLVFNNRFKGWYNPLYEVSIGTPRSYYVFIERLHESGQ